MTITQAARDLLQSMESLYQNDFGGYQCNRDEATDISYAMNQLEGALAEPVALRLAHWLARDGATCSAHIDAADELRRLHAVNEDLLKAVRQLACLGMGDRYGNSDGNIIAQVALNKATGETA